MPKGVPAVQPSQRDDWGTPHDLFDTLWDEVGGFDLDPCCQVEDYTAKRVLAAGGEIMIPPPPREDGGPTISGPVPGLNRAYYDGLKMPWHGKVYMNPPYGLALRKWVPKAVHEVECGNVEFVMAAAPSRTETRWWQEHVVSNCETYTRHEKWYWAGGDRRLRGAVEIRFLKSRLQFVGAPDPATFPSAIVVWRR